MQSVQYLVNHIVPPPQLPSSAESPKLVRHAEKHLFRLVEQAVQQLLQHSPVNEKPIWTVLGKTFRYWTTVHNQDGLPAELLLRWVSEARKDGMPHSHSTLEFRLNHSDVIPLVVNAQNASVIIRIRKNGGTFESFELSPRPGPVINCKTSLRRSFPAGAVFVRKSTFDNDNFRTQIVQTLGKLDMETVDEMAPTAKKAGHPLNTGGLGFASLYYDASNKHKNLRQKIEADAMEQKAAKKAEWERKQMEYNSLKAEAAALRCTMIIDDWGNETHNRRSCHKCEIEKKAQEMTIDIYEWPLPQDEAQCRAALFELDCPPGFAAWRKLTWLIIQDLGRTRPSEGTQPSDTVLSYSGLKDYQNQGASRIVLASETKSYMKSHYRTLHFPVKLSQLYCNNALRYLYFDEELRIWTTEQTEPPDFAPHCNSIVPKGAYHDVQYAVNATLHHQAKVIADQDSSSRNLTLHEFIAFGSLRADGEQTQWLNIQRELEASNLTLNTEAVCILIIQATSQAGSKGNTSLRLTHVMLESASFCTSLVDTTRSLLASIGANWTSHHTMMLVIVVALRIANLTTDEDCRSRALELLHKCRQIMLDWAESLSKLLESTGDNNQIERVQQTLLKIGLLGKLTYSLDRGHVKKGLDSAEDLKYWVFFSITVHDNTPGSKANLSAIVRRLLLNDKKLSYEISATVRALLSKGDNNGLDRAIKIIWSSFEINSAPWTPLPLHNERWLQKRTSAVKGQTAQVVSYNVLEGELLVSGRPLGRLPQEYIHSDLYLRIFGSQIFSVCTSNMPGMLYMSARDVEGHQLHFGKRDSRIVIRMWREGRCWESIPHGQLRDDFPSILVEEFSHWLEISTRVLEFRSLGELYKQRNEWQLDYNIASQSVLWRGTQKLVDVRSKTVDSINSVFAPLETSSYIHVTWSSKCQINIELPRLGLRFWLNQDGELECRELRKIVDPDQYVGTFVGLRNKMVLCERGPFAQQLDRTIIVPAEKAMFIVSAFRWTNDKFKLLFLFAIIAYGPDIPSREDLQTLLAFAFLSELREVQDFPQKNSVDLRTGSYPEQAVLAKDIKHYTYPFKPSQARLATTDRRREKAQYDSRLKAQADNIAKIYVDQWPCAQPVGFADAQAPLLKAQTVHNYMLSRFAVLMENREMEAYLVNVQAILDGARDSSVTVNPPQAQAGMHSVRSYSACAIPDMATLLSLQAPEAESLPDQLHIAEITSSPTEDKKLRCLISCIGSTTSTSYHNTIRHRYKADLEASLDAFRKYEEPIHPATIPHDLTTIQSTFDSSKQYLNKLYKRICTATQSNPPSSTLLTLSGLWPRLTLIDFLELLASIDDTLIDEQWIDCLLQLGKAVTIYQRARRLVLAAEARNVPSFFSEIHNLRSTAWDPRVFPEWLLIEVENDILIRPTQARVAREMLKPSCSSNMLTQLNMGEGKSSVIVPLVASAAANGQQLSRVLVLKSLTTQMMDTLVHRLGGLVGRQVFFMPFSRKTQVDEAMLSHMQTLYKDCVKSRGILLMQPEFLLSFKLMGIERLTSGDLSLGKQLLKIQSWLDANAKDLLDESDEILDVKFQLIYTIGNQRHMDGQPERWLLTQSVFGLVNKHATAIASESPDDIEMTRRSDASFPTIRLLASHAGSKLNSRLVADILESKLPWLNLDSWNLVDKGVLSYFLLNVEVGKEVCSTVTYLCRNDESLMKRILLLRGLIAHNILQFILAGKRWSVNFGQHPNRCLVAVPYRAKGVPAATAEFGHPDVTITLTCLTYYYSGLSNNQMRLCFELLLKADDPSLEYETWTSRSNMLPSDLRKWNAVNLEDHQQCNNVLFPALKYCKSVADFYMANVVFPREGKEFDQKLSSSGWDIPLTTSGGQQLTTGFSGTNDNRFLLPSSITQQDLPELRHTSGKVLSYVLRTENLRYESAKDVHGRQLSTGGLLRFINRVDRKAKVLVDVGAQVLEITNEDVVKDLVRLADDVDAGIFFNDEDKVMVLAKENWTPEPFATSSFSNRIDRCLVYLDEVHTRGTDLKLPKDSRAVVTLGPRLTKDRLVQACMRLRQLGHGQSLFFVAPPEVHRDILKITGKCETDGLDGYDVINWALAQSCLNIERSEPLRIMQGLSYHRRQHIAQKYFTDGLDEGKSVENTRADVFIEKEEQSLYDLYAPSSMKSTNETSLLNISSQDHNTEVQALLHRWKQIDPKAVDSANVLEEHEREVAHEVEQETEIQRPPPAKPLKELVDARLKPYVQNGTSQTFKLFSLANKTIVRRSSAGKLARHNTIWPNVRVSDGFHSVVEKPASGFYDDYFRPVNWILTSKHDSPVTELLIISQYEANELMNAIRDPSSAVLLHVYEPRVTRAMSSVDSSAVVPLPLATQNWLTLSPDLRLQLHLFAGQLYINTYKEYAKFRTASPSILPSLAFLKEWSAIRRRGQNFSQTHIGRIANGWNLRPEDF
ncbi:MAG: hypothetical protein Q9195_003606 [Heterodermia aff. obscurata]